MHNQLINSPEQHFPLLIAGKGGKLGRDLGALCALQDIPTTMNLDDAAYLAICTPSHVASEILASPTTEHTTIIDLSGAAKRDKLGSYGLMKTDSEPWQQDFDVQSHVFGNPGCIASAVILGLHAAGIQPTDIKSKLSVVSVGGRSHTTTIYQDDLRFARRQLDHPHVAEIEKAYDKKIEIASFMPVICDVPSGLLVSVSGTLRKRSHYNEGISDLSARDVVGTDALLHKLSIESNPQSGNADFSLGVAIDNVRFVTANALRLMHYIRQSRQQLTRSCE